MLFITILYERREWGGDCVQVRYDMLWTRSGGGCLTFWYSFLNSWFVNLSATAGFFGWCSINLTYIFFRTSFFSLFQDKKKRQCTFIDRGMKAQGFDVKKSTYHNRLQVRLSGCFFCDEVRAIWRQTTLPSLTSHTGEFRGRSSSSWSRDSKCSLVNST